GAGYRAEEKQAETYHEEERREDGHHQKRPGPARRGRWHQTRVAKRARITRSRGRHADLGPRGLDQLFVDRDLIGHVPGLVLAEKGRGRAWSRLASAQRRGGCDVV